MTAHRILIAATTLWLAVPVVPALAHDENGYGYPGEHGRLHEQLSEAHQRAHEEGFESRAEHRAYHRALRDLHEDFHEEHPGYRNYYYWRPRSYGWGSWGWRY